MNNPKNQLIDYLKKALTLSQEVLKNVQTKEFAGLDENLNNRERAINIATSLQEQVALIQTNETQEEKDKYNLTVYMLIEQINGIDEIITQCLEQEKNKTQLEIAKTHKNKENFKGYNLNKIR